MFISVGLLLLLICHSHAQTASSETDALLELYITTKGEEWHTKTNWMTGDPCESTWFGVSCQDTDSLGDSSDDFDHIYRLYGRVTDSSLSLSLSLSLSVCLSLSYKCLLFSNLSYSIHCRNLPFNLLHNTVPQSIGNLSQLQYLWVCFRIITSYTQILRILSILSSLSFCLFIHLPLFLSTYFVYFCLDYPYNIYIYI